MVCKMLLWPSDLWCLWLDMWQKLLSFENVNLNCHFTLITTFTWACWDYLATAFWRMSVCVPEHSQKWTHVDLNAKSFFFIYILKKKRLTISLVIFYFWSWLLFYFTTFSNTRKTDLCVEISRFFSNTVLLKSSDDNTSNIYIKLHHKVTHFHILRTEEQGLMLE